MIVWTIQPYKVYQKIMDEGIFFCNPELSINLKDDHDFSRAYHWMIQQMIKQIGPSNKKDTYPIWAWYRSRDYQHRRPDFRWVKDYPDEVCIELEIPEKKVLLSDFQGWHFVLNDWYYSDAKSDEEWDCKEKWFDNLTVNQQQRVKEESWQRIFDITPRHGEWEVNGDVVQACFWAIKKIRSVRCGDCKKGKKFS